MDGLYSVTLLVALLSAAIGAISGVLVLFRPTTRWRRIALCFASLSLLFGAVSIAVHLHDGHGPASPEPMKIGRFLRIHPAYGVVLLLSLIGFGTRMFKRRLG